MVLLVTGNLHIIRVNSSGMIFISDLIRVHEIVPKLLGEDRHTHKYIEIVL
jgi:hypothetical protein